jgi:2-polyprenyl-6-hydroxyphenyl methylase / 3-demethylubiquinone-9 3-methyltransferase
LIGDLRGKNFLDYGCGAGLFIVHAARSGARRIVGVDAEATVISTARYFLEKEGVPGKCEFIVSDSFPALEAGTRFDVILMKDVIEHIEEDDELLGRAAAMLAPGGALVISTQNALSLNYLTQGLYHRIIRGNKGWFGWDETHLRFYTPSVLQRKLIAAGLHPLLWRSNYIIPHKFPRRSSAGKMFYRMEALANIDLLLGRFFPWNRLGWNIMVKGTSSSPGSARK